LIVRGPGLARGRVVDAPFVNMDWMPTLLELAGAPAARPVDGISQAGVLTSGKSGSGSRPLYWHIPHYTNQGSRPAGAMREGRWKLVEHYDDGKAELFDLTADPGERTDVAANEGARAAAMRARLRDWRTSVRAQESTPNPAFDAGLYKQIYVDFDSTRFDPRGADAAAWKEVAVWRQRMDAAIRRPKP
jgi:arylsulfatase A